MRRPQVRHEFSSSARSGCSRFIDTGHFALETHGARIAREMRSFLDRHIGPARR
ncbi:MAG: hypothetical protein ABWY27_20780 [Telluria sp.]